ncbi:DUF2786 domain-containing protein [Ruoffia tabacinasalis]|uniref:DUF2786 domain-containing protein n=1 Tax=Ruoffia tabacinasalis TaxID=87458 RepID=A0A5R9EK77_9LACT|nr:DUF2786 domain-containing protein [Ruoffia tabacinasalis]TLQ49483.1 DUF2786 domain-containing protein [Ruoffia tabacinasalis]
MTNNIKDSNDKIISKIKELLALSRDNNQDEESQSAFLLAQRLMLKHQLDFSAIEDYEVMIEREAIGEESVTVYKRLYWFERELARIISKNFRVKFFYNSRPVKSGAGQKKTSIIFYGKRTDLEFAKVIYSLASEILVYHSKKYLEKFYQEIQEGRSQYWTARIKRNYIRGFLIGLNNKLSEQVVLIKEEYPLLVLIPEEVEKAYEEFSLDFGTATLLKLPNPDESTAFNAGIEEGFTRSTLADCGGEYVN